MTSITLAAGCFWGVEAHFQNLAGIESTRVGYIGGKTSNPDYKQVCTGTSGHAEAIELHFNPEIISVEALLLNFWQMHDPTTLNQQGPDIGTQYRSAVFYHNEQQQQLAEATKQHLNNRQVFRSPIVTEITAVSTFYPAEEYHQCYLEKKGLGSCH
ncbi:peptide-methionine (S)-S-oxide reductase [Methylophaga sp. 41_12_T18]|nr:peptide-methionine (S)-S-oxide reductase [Methylophaga sp. 41_12_T18]